jgi:hypothetical protein
MKRLLTFVFVLTTSFAICQSKNVFLKLGTTGIGAGYEQKLNTRWRAIGSLSYMNISPSILLKGSSNQHLLKGTAQFFQLELAAKWFPRASSTSYGITTKDKFFLKGGLLIRDNGNYFLQSDYQKIKPGNQFDNTDPESGKLNFNLITNIIQPFVTLGFELLNTDNKWCATIEAGLSYHGTSPTTPFVNYYETGAIKLYEPNFDKWVRVPRIIRLVKVYPLLNFTIGRRF